MKMLSPANTKPKSVSVESQQYKEGGERYCCGYREDLRGLFSLRKLSFYNIFLENVHEIYPPKLVY